MLRNNKLKLKIQKLRHASRCVALVSLVVAVAVLLLAVQGRCAQKGFLLRYRYCLLLHPALLLLQILYTYDFCSLQQFTTIARLLLHYSSCLFRSVRLRLVRTKSLTLSTTCSCCREENFSVLYSVLFIHWASSSWASYRPTDCYSFLQNLLLSIDNANLKASRLFFSKAPKGKACHYLLCFFENCQCTSWTKSSIINKPNQNCYNKLKQSVRVRCTW